jgi:hypothetical protein
MRDLSKLRGHVINVVLSPEDKGYSPIPDAAWVKDLGLSPSEISDWLADSVEKPNSPDAIYAGMGDTGDWYVACINDEEPSPELQQLVCDLYQ